MMKSENFENGIHELIEVYELIMKLSEAKNGEELFLACKTISIKNDHAFEFFENPNINIILLLETLKLLEKKYAFFKIHNLFGNSACNKTIYNHLNHISERIKKLEFDYYKTKDKCNCELRKTLGLQFDSVSRQNLTLIEEHNDDYENYEIYLCKLCNAKWVYDRHYDTDDGASWHSWDKDRYK